MASPLSLASAGPGDSLDPLLAAALANAARACHQAVIDYRSGLLDDAEVTRTLVRSGVVVTAGEVWMLDVDERRWWRYRGAAPTTAHHQPEPGAS